MQADSNQKDEAMLVLGLKLVAVRGELGKETLKLEEMLDFQKKMASRYLVIATLNPRPEASVLHTVPHIPLTLHPFKIYHLTRRSNGTCSRKTS